MGGGEGWKFASCLILLLATPMLACCILCYNLTLLYKMSSASSQNYTHSTAVISGHTGVRVPLTFLEWGYRTPTLYELSLLWDEYRLLQHFADSLDRFVEDERVRKGPREWKWTRQGRGKADMVPPLACYLHYHHSTFRSRLNPFNHYKYYN